MVNRLLTGNQQYRVLYVFVSGVIMTSSLKRKSTRRLLLAGTGLLLIAFSGCALRGDTTGSVSPAAGNAAIATGPAGTLAQGTQYWQTKYENDLNDKIAGINYSRHLRASNRASDAVGIMRQLSSRHPQDTAVMGELGKSLAASGSLDDALRVLEQATSTTSPEWQLVSAKGAVLDQMGRSEDAQSAYQRALQIAPGEPAILSNLGLSYALSGDLIRAEHTLRQALEHPRATPKVRENLSLVLGLQGRYEEAEEVAAAGHLSQSAASNNTDYLRNMRRQPDRWTELQQTN